MFFRPGFCRYLPGRISSYQADNHAHDQKDSHQQERVVQAIDEGSSHLGGNGIQAGLNALRTHGDHHDGSG